MFTGIITDVGVVRAVEARGDTRFVITTSYDIDKIDIGASVACSGACLTVVEKGWTGNTAWLAFDASAETLSKTNLGSWAPGTRVNLERALKVGDELGGHIVSGHVDGVATLVDARPEGQSMRITIEAPEALSKFIAEKGSVTLDGASLTVNEVDGNRFGVNLIPHTQAVTTFNELNIGRKFNLEADLFARYVARLLPGR